MHKNDHSLKDTELESIKCWIGHVHDYRNNPEKKYRGKSKAGAFTNEWDKVGVRSDL